MRITANYTPRPTNMLPLFRIASCSRRALLIGSVVYFVFGYTVWNLSQIVLEQPSTPTSLQLPVTSLDSQILRTVVGDDVTHPKSFRSTPNAQDAATPTVLPRYVHVTWFYPNRTSFRFHQAISLLSVQRFFRPEKIFFWHDTLPTGPWWIFVRQSVAHLLLVPYRRPESIFNRTVHVPEHQSDVARIEVLLEFGGLYLDLDVIVVKDLSPLLTYDVTLGAETPDMLGSGFILARANSSFLRLWRSSYVDFDDTNWNHHSTVVPMVLARRRPELVHVEWFSINRPNWFERDWLYTVGRLWDWSENYAVHLWYREHNVDYNPITIRTLNTTVAEIFRFIYYEHPRILKAAPDDFVRV